ncbi:MAG TPA: outer membrane protein transport protein [Gallionellaceae bacterium]
MKKRKIAVSLLIAGGLASPLAQATNGYLPIGYGVKNEGMGGVGIALPQDSLAAAVNPAGMVMVGDRADVGLTLFRPNRDLTISGNGAGMNGSYSGNGRTNFLVPNLGYNKMINPDMSLGVSIYGNGGMNTQYNNNPLTPIGGQGAAGVNLAQLFISPTWSMKLNDKHSIGVAINFAYQTFSAQGLQPFDNAGFSAHPGSVTNNGTDSSTGIGIRLGWTGQVTDMVTLGATFQPKTKMSKFSKYSGLFADGGSFDIPATYGAGVAVKANQQTTIGFDVVKIQYSGVSSVGNSAGLPPPQFGAAGGPGFAWQDMTVYKLGFAYAYDSNLTLRAGFNHNSQQIGSNAAFINFLAPGVVQNHLTLGSTWKMADKSELSVAYIHAFSQTVTGPIPGPLGAGNASIRMHEDSIGVMYGW